MKKTPMHIGIAPDDARIPQVEQEITFNMVSNYPDQPHTDVMVKTDAVTLQDILPVFEEFLRGAGFYFKGHVAISEEEV